MSFLYENLFLLSWQQVTMWVIGGILIYLAIAKDMEPSLLLPIGFGAILVNMPFSGAVNQTINGIFQEGPLSALYEAGIANELFPLLLFIGIGAMCDFGPLLTNPALMMFGAAAQFGIFFTFCLASMFFPANDAASIATIGAADGPTAIVVAQKLHSTYLGPIMVAAYSYMALVPIIQPPVIRFLTSKKERMIRMDYEPKDVSRTTRILFPIIITVIAGLANMITLLLGITVASQMQAENFLKPDTLMILGMGLFAFVFDTAGGVLFAKFLNLFLKKKVNPMIGAAGISAFPMSGRIIHKMGLEEDNQNFLLMHSMGVNVSGQIASVIAGGLIMSFFM